MIDFPSVVWAAPATWEALGELPPFADMATPAAEPSVVPSTGPVVTNGTEKPVVGDMVTGNKAGATAVVTQATLAASVDALLNSIAWLSGQPSPDL